MANPGDCVYVSTVDCTDKSKCKRCGWNPTEEKRRANYIKKHRTNAGMIKGRMPIERSNTRAICVKATNIKTGEVRTYESIREAEKTDKFRSEGIRAVISGAQRQHKGWVFEKVVEE